MHEPETRAGGVTEHVTMNNDGNKRTRAQVLSLT